MLCFLADPSGQADAGLSSEGEALFHESVASRGETLQVPELKETFNVQRGKEGFKGVFYNELIDTCVRIIGSLLLIQNFRNVPRSVYFKAFSILRQRWVFLLEEDQQLYDGKNPSTWNSFKKSKARHEVAKCLVLLGMEYDHFSSETEEEKSPGIPDTNTLEFRQKFWEQSPILVTKAMPSCLASFAKRCNTLKELLNNFVSRFTTCPSASADQVDSFMYFRQVEYTLGDPLIYGRDIKIMKTVKDFDGKKPNESEVHYFPPDLECGSCFVHPKEMLDAIMMGFSLAIKGLELRCPDIAKLAETLAEQFGQASVGVNLYVTPPNAQGLAVHFDDHCVFVCQLHGHKSWRIFPPVQLLPRLYDSRSLDEEALQNSAVEQVNLQQGYVLYIPRGYPHKAFCEDKFEEKSNGADVDFKEITGPFFGCGGPSDPDVATHGTSADLFSDSNKKQRITSICLDSTGGECETPRNAVDNRISTHLTFGVEVEPPFEWEGLVHIALRLWLHQKWRSAPEADSEVCAGEEELCEALLHVAIKSIAAKDIRFRKACMIAAKSPFDSRQEEPVPGGKIENGGSKNVRCGALDPVGCGYCNPSSLTYFEGLIAAVSERVRFSEALNAARSYLQNETDEVDVVGMVWLRLIPNTNERFKHSENLDPVDLLQGSDLDKLACEKTFTDMKAEFGQASMFHDASEVFRNILNQYRIMRKKSRNGMLALHGGFSQPVCDMD